MKKYEIETESQEGIAVSQKADKILRWIFKIVYLVGSLFVFIGIISGMVDAYKEKMIGLAIFMTIYAVAYWPLDYLVYKWIKKLLKKWNFRFVIKQEDKIVIKEVKEDKDRD